MFELGLSRRLWPIHFKPYDDELLSSWLVRLSLAHGVKPTRFAAHVWGSATVWDNDIDKGMLEEVLQVMADQTATPPERVLDTTFRGYAGAIPKQHASPGVMYWVLLTGSRSRVRYYPWLPYCPRCLREDAEPYFRRPWRLAFVTVCIKHRQPLLDRCLGCTATFNCHRLTNGNPSITRCYRCGMNACQAEAPTLGNHPAYGRLVQFQSDLMAALQWGSCTLIGPEPIKAQDYLLVLRQLARVLTTRKRGPERVKTLCEYAGQPYFEPRFPAATQRPLIETLATADRFQLMLLLSWWLDQWPDRFVDVCESVGLGFPELMLAMEVKPDWYKRVARQVHQ